MTSEIKFLRILTRTIFSLLLGTVVSGSRKLFLLIFSSYFPEDETPLGMTATTSVDRRISTNWLDPTSGPQGRDRAGLRIGMGRCQAQAGACLGPGPF